MKEEKPTTCRVCLSAGEQDKVSSLLEPLDSRPLYEHVMSVADVTIAPDDGLPASVCAACLLELRAALLFKSKCEASDRALRSSWDERLADDILNIKEEVDNFDELPVHEYLRTVSDCDYNTETKSEIITPVKSQGVQCNECHNIFKSKCKLRMHWKKEHMQRRFVCATCKRVFKTLPALTRHKQMAVQSCTDLLNNDDVSVEGEGKGRMFQCNHCKYRVHRWIHMRQHIVIHTPWAKPFKCDLCQSAYSQAGSLKQHRATSHGEITEKAECHICGKVFTTRRSLYKHFQTHQEAKLTCPVCSILVKSKASLQNHMKRHSGSKSYTCENCAAAFYTSAELANHRRHHHTKKLFFKCKLCEFRCPRRARLLKHEVRHSGVKGFPCTSCGKFYETPHHLDLHLSKYHKPKRFRCPVCPNQFVARNSLKRHVKEKHGYQILGAEPMDETKDVQCSEPTSRTDIL